MMGYFIMPFALFYINGDAAMFRNESLFAEAIVFSFPKLISFTFCLDTKSDKKIKAPSKRLLRCLLRYNKKVESLALAS